MVGENGQTLKENIETLFSEYDRSVKEARCAIQIIGPSVSLLSVFKDWRGLNSLQIPLVQSSLGLLFLSLTCAVVSYLLLVWFRPRNERLALIGTPDQKDRETIADKFSEKNAQTALKRSKWIVRLSYSSYILFSLIGDIIGDVYIILISLLVESEGICSQNVSYTHGSRSSIPFGG